jgi:hypothetical protein
METHYAHLIDDKAFKIISSFALDLYENGCSIITCSFNNDLNCIIVLGIHVLPKDHNGLSLAMKFSFFIFPCIRGLILALKMFDVCQ